jgi:hypothetical protein
VSVCLRLNKSRGACVEISRLWAGKNKEVEPAKLHQSTA